MTRVVSARRCVAPLLVIVWATTLLGCGTRVITVTGTTLGLKATPGDGQSRPPQVTLGYKRSESSIVPTKGATATTTDGGADAFSTLTSFYLQSEWFGETRVSSFIGTGTAATSIIGSAIGSASKFPEAFAAATAGRVSPEIQTRRVQLVNQIGALSPDQVTRVLGILRVPVPGGQTPVDALKNAIADARTDIDVARIGDAFNQVR